MDNETANNIQQQINIINQSLEKALSLKDVPVGSRLAKELNLSFGDLDLVERDTNTFVWGLSAWGNARIGGNSKQK